MSAPTIDPAEIEKFSRIATERWDPHGKFRPLHKFNPVRLAYIRDAALSHFRRDGSARAPLEGLTLIDIGCGGGLVAEPMRRLGASAGVRFDIVLNLDAVEHAADPKLFIEASAELLRPGGLLVVATIKRTLMAFALAKIGAEYVLGWLPRGTHDPRKFVKPEELESFLAGAGLSLTARAGVAFDPLADRWRLSEDLSVNYMLTAVRR
mgnify:CR=1 FL=1